ncbi:Fc receptor-like protein 5 isoform X2 [Pungitius pungitius]|uniref:Fc receptor-like protein 5 isoform X2 n=1 Tax=Pungitius pungitius TaxID=134920 RepID=UPI002E128C61
MGHTLFAVLGLFSLNILLYCGHTQDVPQPVLTVSPSWTSPGDSVTLNCSVEPPSAGWRFFWYRAVPNLPPSNYSYTSDLLPGSTTGTEQGSYILHGQTHTAGYVCRAGRGDPVIYTRYSDVKFVWSGGVNPAASLTVSPHRLQHFRTESLSLGCEGTSTEWRVVMVDEFGFMSSCSYWGEMTGSTCNTSTRASSGVYWCESETQCSNAANITIHSRPKAQLSKDSPVEGRMTLTCAVWSSSSSSSGWKYFWYKDKRTSEPLKTRDGVLFQSGSISPSGGGVYWCRGGRGDPVYYTKYSDPVVTNRAVVTLQPDRPEIYSGETITLTCGIKDGGGFEWEYEWRTPHYYTPQYTRGSMMTSSVRGDYRCKGRLKFEDSTTEWSDALTLKTSPRPKAQLSHDSHVEGSVTLTCSVGSSSSSGWKYFWYRDKKTSEPLKTRDDFLLQNRSISPSGGGVYWCRGGRGHPVYYSEYSHPVDVPRPVLKVSPSWPSPGNSVTLTCSVEPPSAEWRFFWYKAVPDQLLSPYLNYNYYRYELLSGSTTGTEQGSYILHGQTHTAGYVCRAGRGDPAVYTWYSRVKFLWSGGDQSLHDVSSGVNLAASLTVSPHRLQHFSTESLSLSCEGTSTEWRVMKADGSGFMSSCSYWGEMTGSTCNTSTRASSGVYWCESETQSSNAANITIHSGDVILVSPVRPVTEGHSVTLGCKLRTKELLDDVDFYKDDKLLPNAVRGELFISAVNKSHEGFYECRGRKSPQSFKSLTSAESWLSVEYPEEAASSSVFLVMLVVGLVSGVLLILLLLMFLCRYRKSKASSLSRSQKTNQNQSEPQATSIHMMNQGDAIEENEQDE